MVKHRAKTRKIIGQCARCVCFCPFFLRYVSKEQIKSVTCTANRDVVNDADIDPEAVQLLILHYSHGSTP